MKKLHALLALAMLGLAGCGDGGIQSPDFTPELTNVRIVTPDPATVVAGRTVQIEGVGVFTSPPGSDDAEFEKETDLDWETSDATTATVDGNGLVTGVREGTVTITAGRKKFSDTIVVNVGAAVLTGITVTPATATIAEGEEQQFTVSGTYSDGSTGPVTDSVDWSSNNEGVATVDANGNATAIDTGSATITAQAENTEGELVTGTATLTVSPPTVVAIIVNPDSATIAAGRTQAFHADGIYSDGQVLPIDTTVSWASNDITVATVTTPGVDAIATGLQEGSATITASTVNSLGRTVSGTAELTVGAPVLTGITVLPDDPSVALGNTQEFTVEGTYSDGSTGAVTVPVVWASTNEPVATIDSAGLATTLSKGSTNISATATNEEGDDVTGVSTLTVTDAVATGLLTVTPDPADVAAGTTQIFTAQGTFSDGSTGDVDNSLLDWTSSVEQVATINANGLASAIAEGTTTITASLKSGVPGSPRTASATMNVTPPILTSIVIEPADSSLAAGTTSVLEAKGIYTDSPTPRAITGTIDCPSHVPPVTGAASVEWESADPTIATVTTPGNTSTVKGVLASPDPVVISATSVNSQCVDITGTATVTVTDALLVSMVRVEPPTQFVREGLQTADPYVAIGEYSDTVERPIDNTQIDWTTGDNAIATIDAEGVATGVSEGTVTITATLKAGVVTDVGENRTADASLTVTDSECTTPLLASNGASTFVTTGGLCLAPLCGVTAQDNAIDADPASFATINATLNLLGASATLGVNSAAQLPGGEPAGFRIARPAGLLLSAELLSQVTVSTLLNGGVQDASGVSNPLRLTLLGMLGDEEYAVLSIDTTLPFDAMAITFNGGIASALTTVNVANACATVVVPDVAAKRLVKKHK